MGVEATAAHSVEKNNPLKSKPMFPPARRVLDALTKQETGDGEEGLRGHFTITIAVLRTQ